MSSFKISHGLHSPKYAQKKRKKILLVIFLCIFCASALLAFSVLLARSPFFQIDTIAVKGSSAFPTDMIKEKVLSVIHNDSEKIAYGLFPKTSIFFFSKDKIEKALRQDFKEIDTLSIRRSGPRELTLFLQDRLPSALVCFGFREDNLSKNCYFSDKHGYVFLSLTSSSRPADSYNHYYIPTDKGDNPFGTAFIEEKRFQELERFVNGSRRGGLFPLGVLIEENGDYEMYIKNKKGNSEVTVYFDDKAPFDATLSNLLTFWQNYPATTTPTFDYINLRFGNTVYYSTQ